ncbi:MAG: hypothetical protein M3389_06645 [Actinomycetota bacterium]|nr:hypothetical protein [Actinomycetota bacterium]
MTDEQWLRAFEKYAGQEWSPHDLGVGGAYELGRELAQRAKGDPDRFIRLALHPKAASDPAYIVAIIDVLKEVAADATPELVFDFIRHVASLHLPEHERRVGDVVRAVRDRDIPRDIIEILVERALHAASPAPHDPPTVEWSGDEEGDDAQLRSDLWIQGLNTARGHLVTALADLLIHDADGSRTAIVAPHLAEFAQEPHSGVRACVARLVAAALGHAEAEAVAVYLPLTEGQDAALATDPFESLTVFVSHRDADAAAAVIDRMLESDDRHVRRAAGRLSAFMGLERERPGMLAEALAAEDAFVRRGAAEICSHRLTFTKNSEGAQNAVRALLTDPDLKVRTAAADVAPNLRGAPLRPYAPLLHDVIQAPAFDAIGSQLLLTLEAAPDRVDDLVLASARRFVDEHGRELGDFSTGAAADARELCTLVLRAYAQAPDPAGRAAALDLIDQLLLLGAYGIEEALSESER